MKKKLKWGLRVGKTFYAPGTEVRLATLVEAQEVFPAIRLSENSNQVAVWLPDMPHPTIIHRKEVE
jgi:hypothetical protein